MSNQQSEVDEVDEIFSDQTEANRRRPRHVFELPAELVLMIKRNNMLLEKMERHIEFGLKSPWLKSALAAKYIGVSKAHLLHNLKGLPGEGKIDFSKDDDGKTVIFHIDDLDNYWFARKNSLKFRT